MNIYFPHSKQLEYEDYYSAIHKSAFYSSHICILPYEKNSTPQNSKSLIKKSDLIIAEVSYPGTGLGIELGWADALGKKIVCVYMDGYTLARSLSIVSNDFIAYKDFEDLIKKIQLFLENCNKKSV